MSTKKKPLGRGLESLIPKAEATPNTSGSQGLTELRVTDIKPNPNQPRKQFDPVALDELVESIRAKGVIQPIIVTKVTDGYIIIAGERRWRASGLAGLTTVPVVVKNVATETERLELALIENIQRQDLNPVELARAYQNLLDTHGYRQEDVSVIMGKSRSAVANTLRLLNLPNAVLNALEEGTITEGHARPLLALDAESDMITAMGVIVKKELSARQAEQLVKKMKDGGNDQASAPKQTDDNDVFLRSLAREIEEHFSAKIAIKPKKNGGTIEIQYANNDELERIVGTIRGEGQ